MAIWCPCTMPPLSQIELSALQVLNEVVQSLFANPQARGWSCMRLRYGYSTRRYCLDRNETRDSRFQCYVDIYPGSEANSFGDVESVRNV